MAGGNVPVTFRVFKGDELLREETYTQPTIKIGKLASSHLRLDDVSISRMHAVVEISPAGEVSIVDLGSTKGTFVNGEKVSKTKLSTGDKIALGTLTIEVEIGVAEEAAPEPVAAPVSAPTAQPVHAQPVGTPPQG